jgi:hypothetical protein
MVNEVLAIRRKVETETDVRRLRRWCVALLQDHGEMSRKLEASRPSAVGSSATDTPEPNT